MKKMKLTETELVNLIGKTIKEQSRLGYLIFIVI